MIKNNPLLDDDFLADLSQQQERTVYARVVALNMQEEPQEEITGRVTQGSINVDGNSSARRSFSLSLIANEMNLNDYYWGLNSKIQLFIGIKNLVNDIYDDIIWFKQGTFIMSSFNTSQSTNNYTISVQGKDKMCKLNGELGGMIESLTANFGQVIAYSRDSEGKLVSTKEDIPVKDIIREGVHKYGNEPYSNIIINDLDDYGLELLEYRGDEDHPLYMEINLETNEVENLFFQSDKTYYKYGTQETIRVDDESMVYDSRTKQDFAPQEDTITLVSKINESDQVNDTAAYSIAKIEYGEVCGYKLTELTYPGDLIAKAGEAFTSVLDKIKNMLGEFEYFYDVDGKFIFQKKKTYVQVPFNGLTNSGMSEAYVRKQLYPSTYVKNMYYVKKGGEYVIASGEYSATAIYYEKVDGENTSGLANGMENTYSFINSKLVTQFSNNPNYANLKNDFSIWGGKKSSASDKTIPIHLRYAIDQKPTEYTAYDGLRKYTVRNKDEVQEEILNLQDFQKTPNKNGLPEEWWDVHEWAEIYRLRTGAYPTASIGTYCPNVQINIKDYFNTASTNPNVHYNYYVDAIFYYIDTNTYQTSHGGCIHPYTYFMDLAKNGVGAYIHNPKIPESESGKVEGDTLYFRDTEIITDCDWREIIYQMALDYNKYSAKDDFMLKTYTNNEGLFYENGSTGYEAYYTDLEGFWRDLYNPQPDIDGGVEFIKVVGSVIEAVNDKNEEKWITNEQMRSLGESFYKYFKKNVKEDRYDFIQEKDFDTKVAFEDTKNAFWTLIESKQYPDDDIKLFYAWDSTNQTYTKKKFKDVVALYDVPSKNKFTANRLYKSSSGNNYFELKHWEEHSYYERDKSVVLTGMDKDTTYYYLNGSQEDSVLTEENASKHIWEDNTGFQIGKKYYTFAGYTREKTLEKDVQYYTREATNDKYVYKPAFTISSEYTYQTTDPGMNVSQIRVDKFTAGNTYYAYKNVKQADGSVKAVHFPEHDFKYDSQAFYYRKTGFKKVLDLTQYTIKDKFYFMEDAIDPWDNVQNIKSCVEIKDNTYYFPIGQTLEYYRFVPADQVKNGRYYTLLPLRNYDDYEKHKTQATAAYNYIKSIWGRNDYATLLEQMKNDTTTYYSSDVVEYAELNWMSEYVSKQENDQLTLLKENYDNEIKKAQEEDRVCRMTQKDYDDGVNAIRENAIKQLNWIAGEYNATSFKMVSVIREFEYDTRYFTRVAVEDSAGKNVYKYVRYNCYYFKPGVGALYKEPKYNIDTKWALDLTRNPANLVFWFDFLDTDGDVFKYSVGAVGNRPKAVNDEKVKAIYYRDTPNVIFVKSEDWSKYRDVKRGYTYVLLSDGIEDFFTVSAQGKTAYSTLEDFLYNYTYCTESISITSIPVYHLQPNTRIAVRDDKSHINGEYLISKLTIPLTYNGTMNISATKAVDTLY